MDRLDDRIVELPFPDRVLDTILSGTEKVQQVFCMVLGHESTGDQCEHPEHDYCLWCGCCTPGMADRSGAVR